MARLAVEDGWPVARAAERFQVSWPTANRWAQRYREYGPEGMLDRSSRPRRCPRALPSPVVRKIVRQRWKQWLGPRPGDRGIAERLGRSPAQVILRWQPRIGDLVIPKSVTPERIRSNRKLSGFELTDDELALIAELDIETGDGPDPDTFS